MSHQVTVGLSGAVVIDVFAPIRIDWDTLLERRIEAADVARAPMTLPYAR